MGWGETTTFHSVYGYDQKSLYNVLTDHLIPAVLGMDPRDRVALHQRMELAIPFNTMAKTGIDLATYDLAAQAAAAPIHALVGGARVDRVPVVAVVDIVPPSQAEEMATGTRVQGVPCHQGEDRSECPPGSPTGEGGEKGGWGWNPDPR